MIATRHFLISILFLFSLSATALARTHAGTVVLTDGKRIEQAQYRVKKAFKIVEIVEIAGMKVSRKFNFNRIAALIDVKGKDVTKKYLGRYIVKPQKTPPNRSYIVPAIPTDSTKENSPLDTAESDSTMTNTDPQTSSGIRTNPNAETWLTRAERDSNLPPSRLKLKNVRLRIGSAFSVPTGSFYEGITSGAGYGADIIIPLTYNFSLRGTVSRAGIKAQDNLHLVSVNGGTTLFATIKSFTATRITAAAEYYFYNRKGVFPPRTVGFFYSGMGAIIHKTTFDATLFDNTTNQQLNAPGGSSSVTNFVAVYGAGADIMLNSTFGLELGVNMDLIFYNPGGKNATQTAYLFDFRVGVVSLF